MYFRACELHLHWSNRLQNDQSPDTCMDKTSSYDQSLFAIDKQNNLRRDCIYNIVNTDQAFTYIYYDIFTHTGVPARLSHYTLSVSNF